MNKVLLTALLLLSLAPALNAGPPERPSGRMVFDEVAGGLRKYHKETSAEMRFRWLKRLAPTGDPRAPIVLGDFLSDSDEYDQRLTVGVLLVRYFLPRPVAGEPLKQAQEAYIWWRGNEADLRCRAAQLPR